jgi:hypothetical protein
MGALAAYRRASVFAGPSFANRVNEAVDADPGLWVNGRPTHWTRMNVRNYEADLAPVTETTCRRYAAGLGDFEAFVVIVPKGATRVLVEIHDEPLDSEDRAIAAVQATAGKAGEWHAYRLRDEWMVEQKTRGHRSLWVVNAITGLVRTEAEVVAANGSDPKPEGSA